MRGAAPEVFASGTEREQTGSRNLPLTAPLASAKYNHWEDDDYNRYLSDLFWDDMLDTAPWMREA